MPSDVLIVDPDLSATVMMGSRAAPRSRRLLPSRLLFTAVLPAMLRGASAGVAGCFAARSSVVVRRLQHATPERISLRDARIGDIVMVRVAQCASSGQHTACLVARTHCQSRPLPASHVLGAVDHTS